MTLDSDPNWVKILDPDPYSMLCCGSNFFLIRKNVFFFFQSWFTPQSEAIDASQKSVSSPALLSKNFGCILWIFIRGRYLSVPAAVFRSRSQSEPIILAGAGANKKGLAPAPAIIDKLQQKLSFNTTTQVPFNVFYSLLFLLASKLAISK